MSRITSDPFEALTPEAQAAILAILEPAVPAAAGAPATPLPYRGLAAGAAAPPEETESGEATPLPAALAPAHNTSDWFYAAIDRWTAEVERLTASATPETFNKLDHALNRLEEYVCRDTETWRAGQRRLEELRAEGAVARRLDFGVGAPPGTPLPPPPAWRQGSCGEAGPFIGLSYGHSVALVKKMRDNPGRNVWELKQIVLADYPEEPDLLRNFTEEEVYEGMAASYSWTNDRTRGYLEGLRAAGS